MYILTQTGVEVMFEVKSKPYASQSKTIKWKYSVSVCQDKGFGKKSILVFKV